LLGASVKRSPMEPLDHRQYATESLSLKTYSIECLRCGICCMRHQAITSLREAQQITAYLNISESQWVRDYSDPRWPSDKNCLIRHINGKCIFLKYDNHMSYCDIQSVKPSCCRNWTPSLIKNECFEGLIKYRAIKLATSVCSP
jgi:Fe-S-cluster containining protein